MPSPNVAAIFGGTRTSFGCYGFSSLFLQRDLLVNLELIFFLNQVVDHTRDPAKNRVPADQAGD
jgi:hypothetical protein